MVSTETFEMWCSRLGSYVNSQMRPREWCEHQGITLRQFYYWMQRITKVASAKALVIHAKPSSHEWLAVDLNGVNPYAYLTYLCEQPPQINCKDLLALDQLHPWTASVKAKCSIPSKSIV